MHECVTPDVLFLSDPAQLDHVRYNLITKSLLQNVSYIRFFAVYRFLFVFNSLYFVFGMSARFKPKKSHAHRSARSLFVRSRFPFQPPSLVLLYTHTHTYHLSRLHGQFAAIHTHVCICIFMYKQALRCVDSDPNSRADKNSPQSIIRFMNMYV